MLTHQAGDSAVLLRQPMAGQHYLVELLILGRSRFWSIAWHASRESDTKG